MTNANRTRRLSPIITAFVLLLLWQAALAGTLPLPDDAQNISREIADRCPACLDQGFSPTGTADIGFGRKFFPNFFLGDPARGLLISYVVAGETYVSLLRENELSSAKAALAKAFRKARLFVIEKNGYDVHGPLPPDSVEVTVTEALHRCLHQTTRPLCCCCTDCVAECCEKKLGSTAVTLRWTDPLHEGGSIIYTYYPHPGASRVVTFDGAGKQTQLRWCLDAGGAGFLR